MRRRRAFVFGLGLGAATAAVVVAWGRRRQPAAPTGPPLGVDHFADVDGHRVHYVAAGDGEPLLLVPGAFTNHGTYRRLMPSLAERFRVLALDYPGTGESVAGPGFDYSPAAQAEVVVRLMDGLGIARASLMGASYGGAIVVNLAAMHPERVKRVVSIEAITHIDQAEAASAVVSRLLEVLPVGQAMAVLSRSPIWDYAAARAIMGGDWRHMTPEAKWTLRTQIRHSAASIQPEAVRGIALAMASGRGRPPGDISVPVLQILGEHSPLRRQLRATNDFLLTHGVDVRFATIAGGSHALEVQRPEAVLGLALPFLLGEGPLDSEDV